MTTLLNEQTSETPGQGVRVLLRVMLLVGDHSLTLGDTEIACDTPAVRTWLAQAPLASQPMTATSLPPAPLSFELRQRLATLCRRLGVAEPLYDQLGAYEAATLLARLQAEDEELLQTVTPAQTAPEQAEPLIEKALIRQLKERWRARYQPLGSVEDMQRDWARFKQHVCGEPVSDRAMQAHQYEQLLAALASPAAERTGTR